MEVWGTSWSCSLKDESLRDKLRLEIKECKLEGQARVEAHEIEAWKTSKDTQEIVVEHVDYLIVER